MLRFVITAMLSVVVLTVSAHVYVTISGRVTDYNGNPVDSCNVALEGHNMHNDEWGESVYFLEVLRYRGGQ